MALAEPCHPSDFIRELGKLIGENENLILSEIESKEAIYDSIKTFLENGL